MSKAIEEFIENADVPQEAEHSCEICGKDFPDNARAVGISGGVIEYAADGFMPDEGPWLLVMCKDCYAKLDDKIGEMMEEVKP